MRRTSRKSLQSNVPKMVGPFDSCFLDDDDLPLEAVIPDPPSPPVRGEEKLLFAVFGQALRDSVSRQRGIAPPALEWLDDDTIQNGPTGFSFGAVAEHLGLATSSVRRRLAEAAGSRARLRRASDARNGSKVITQSSRPRRTEPEDILDEGDHRSAVSR